VTAWRIVGRVLYWIAVFAVSLAFVFVLLRFFEARDDPQLKQPTSALSAAEHRPIASPERSTVTPDAWERSPRRSSISGERTVR
jgi:hypothetical protein